MPQDFVKVAHTYDLPPGQKTVVEVGDERILLINVEGSYYAVDDECTHAYARLSLGQVFGDEMICPVHGAVFNVKTGAVQSPPAYRDLPTYPVRIEGDDILIGPPEA
jgi:3-phenylpropionate/trans-cinnamate dioxygenase ferredoxin subunit